MAVQSGTVFDSFMNAYLGRSGGLLPRTQGMFADRDLEQRQYEFGKNLAQQMAQMAEQRRQFAIQQRNGLISSIIGAVAGTVGAVGGAAASGGMKAAKKAADATTEAVA